MHPGPGARPTYLAEVPREHRRLAAIMFTDMVGFSARSQRNETLTLELLEEHRQLLRERFARYGGREVKTTGDGFLVEFESALDAVLCAVGMQEALAARNASAPPERRVLIRVGVHLGDIVHRENDVFGDGVNIAARLEPLAEPGGICVSEDVYRQIRNKLDVPVTKLGRGELKHIDLPVAVYRVGARGQSARASLAAQARFVLRKKRTWAALLLVALAVAGVATARRHGVFNQPAELDVEDGPLTVAVADFANETKEEDLNGLSGMFITSLEQSRRLSVLTRSRMLDVLDQLGRKNVERIDEVLGRELCQRAQASALVLGTVRRFGTRYIIDLQVVHPARNEYLFTAREQGTGKESIPVMLDRLSEQVRAALKENQAEIRRASAAVAERTTANFEAYQHYFNGEQLIGRATSNNDVPAVMAARKEYEKAVELDPTFALAHFRIASTQIWIRQDATEAIARAMKYLDRAPPKEQLYIRATDARAHGRVDEAVALYRQVLATYPQEKEAQFHLGDVEFHRHHLPEAIAALERVLDIDPGFAVAYDHLIDALLVSKAGEQARRYAWQYVDHVPGEDSSNWFFMALISTQPLPQAEAELRQARERYPDRTSLAVAPARARALAGDLAGAELELAPLLESGRVELRRAALLAHTWLPLYRGRYAEASAAFDAIGREARERQEWPVFSRLVAHQATLASFTGGAAAKLKVLEAQLQAGPTDVLASWEVARAWERAGHPEAMQAMLSRLPVVTPMLAHYVQAHEQAAAGRYADALATLKAGPGMEVRAHPWVLMDLAELSIRQGDPDGVLAAVANLTEDLSHVGLALDLWPVLHMHGRYLLGKAYEAKGEARRAADEYDKLLGLWKDADPDLVAAQDARARLEGLRNLGVSR